MNMPKMSYWFVFWCVFLLTFYLQRKGYDALGITLMLLLWASHLIVFHLAEDDFIGVRIKTREGVELVAKGITIVLALTLVVTMALLFIVQKMISEPREFFKTLQRL